MSEPTSVTYRRLGQSGLRVSVPILGCMSFGHPNWSGDWVIGEEKALPLLKYAWDRGINTWDTANTYSNGESERIIAKAIQKFNIPREKLIILTKCHHLVSENPTDIGVLVPHLRDTKDYVNQSGLSRAAIFNAVDASLRRLETSYIDLLQIHRFDPEVPPEEIMEALHDLIKLGKVRYIGASSMRAWQFQMLNNVAEKHGWTKFVSMQNQYNLLYREEEREMISYCNHAGIGIIPYGPIAGGLLTRPVEAEITKRQQAFKGTAYEYKFSEADKAIISRVQDLSQKKGWLMSQVALGWVAQKVSSPIVGCSSEKRVEEAIISDKALTVEESTYLEEPYIPTAVRGHR